MQKWPYPNLQPCVQIFLKPVKRQGVYIDAESSPHRVLPNVGLGRASQKRAQVVVGSNHLLSLCFAAVLCLLTFPSPSSLACGQSSIMGSNLDFNVRLSPNRDTQIKTWIVDTWALFYCLVTALVFDVIFCNSSRNGTFLKQAREVLALCPGQPVSLQVNPPLCRAPFLDPSLIPSWSQT